MTLDLTKYKALSFDCYGTLIDWEAGIGAVLSPWARERGVDFTDEELLSAYAEKVVFLSHAGHSTGRPKRRSTISGSRELND